ncbi:MAG: hypothetical protein RIQ60_3529 [Pseudomonadota bacterium]|jgi:putative two-component system response regulator
MKPLLLADRADVLVLDDQLENLHLLLDVLSPEFNVHPYTDSEALMLYVAKERPVDLILLDVLMPPPDGYEVCRRLRALPQLEDVPIVFLSALDTPDDEERGLALGAIDYISKPFSAPIVQARVRNHVRLSRAMRLVSSQNDLLDRRVAERTAELAQRNAELSQALKRLGRTEDVTIVALSSLAELRDNETGQHVLRTQAYMRALALAVREWCPHLAAALDDATIEMLYKSAPLHDIGKVAIPDHILLKPGRLDADEYAIMKTHAQLGHDAIRQAEQDLQLDESEHSFLRFAREIALCHHEHWDGGGYPQGLAGTAIPLSARLMALADMYDALICKRVYKPGMSHEQAMAMIVAGRGKQFDPDIVDAFEAHHERFHAIARQQRLCAGSSPEEQA